MNKRRKILYVAMLLLTCIGITSCSKKGATTPFDNNPIATRTLRYLTQRPWKETTLEYQLQDGTWIQKPLAASVAIVSNVFSTNGTYIIYNSDGSVQSSGTYVIIGDNTQLALNFNITYDFSILNDTTMQLTLTGQVIYTDPATNITYTYYGMRQTFRH
ncbi:MAG: hypothetical protein ACXVBH_08650 [Flavisolibacter sp.]